MSVENFTDSSYYPLTHPQKRIWYIEKIHPDTAISNIGGYMHIKGQIDINILEKAINILIKRNDGLRLRFKEQNGIVQQFVGEYKIEKLDFIDFSVYANPNSTFEKWVENEARKPFVLKNGQVNYYFAMYKISDSDYGLLAKFHHIISDGWSLSIINERISEIYTELLNGDKHINDPAFSYIEYIENEQKYLSSSRFLKNKAFWNKKFAVLPELSMNKKTELQDGRRKTYELDSKLSAEIKKLAANFNCSLNSFFVTVYLIYIHKTTQQDDIVIGTPVANRSGKKEKNTIGMFTSTMPLRFVIDDTLTFSETLVKVDETIIESYFHQKYPYDLLTQDLELGKKGYNQLFTMCVNYYNSKFATQLNGLQTETVEFYNGNQLYSMQMIIRDWDNSPNLQLDFDYRIHDYSDEEVEETLTRLVKLINQIIGGYYRKIADLSVLTDVENQLLGQFNHTDADYAKEKTIYHLFEEQAKKTPDKLAIRYLQQEMTYRELNEKANRLARFLICRGIKREDIVGLLTNHTIDSVVAILGILKAGGAYVPIDPEYPAERIHYMLEDSKMNMLLTNVELQNRLDFRGDIIRLDYLDLDKEDASNVDVPNQPSDLVYMIYTSGSTGKPKGTMIEHQGLVNYICWAKKMYVKLVDEVFPLYSSLAFDLTVTSIFTPLVSGGSIVVYDDQGEEHVLLRIIKENKATVIKLTPSHLSLLKNLRKQKEFSIRRFIVGGEDLKVDLAKSILETFGDHVEIFNEYGPTETVVGCMIHKFDINEDTRLSVPIGIPADNMQIYILDKNLKPVAPNTMGELYISGDGLARGYWDKPQLTSEKFIDHPYINGKKMYRTGDLAQFLRNYKIEYIGRIDYQVKLRGYRIELGEIEKQLISHQAVQDSIVVVRKNRINENFLCAYIVKIKQTTTWELREHLLASLPQYMIPDHFIELSEIPLTSNGKVDKTLLPEPEMDVHVVSGVVDYRNQEEEQLVDAIAKILSVNMVSIKQNFYHLGGDSIKAIQIASLLNEHGYKLKVKDVLTYPVIEEMALHMKRNEAVIIDQESCQGNIKPPPITTWFISQNFTNPDHYNQSVWLELNENISKATVEIIMKEIIMHHDSLRLNYKYETNELFYNDRHLTSDYYIYEHDLEGSSRCAQQEQMKVISEKLASNMQTDNDLLFKVCLFKLGNQKKRLYMTAHHLVIDGVSWRIILDDFSTMLQQKTSKQTFKLPAKTHSYQKWAETLDRIYWQDRYKERDYWEAVLKDPVSFPVDYQVNVPIMEQTSGVFAQLNEHETEFLLTKANTSYNTEPKDLLITALLKTMKEISSHEDIIIELEHHGREEIDEDLDITRTVGWFTSLYPFRIRLKDNHLSDVIKQVKEEIRRIPRNGLGFGLLKYRTNLFRDTDRRDIRFNYLGDFTGSIKDKTIQFVSDQVNHDSNKHNLFTCLIDINCYVINKKLTITMSYNTMEFLQETMQTFISAFYCHIRSILKHCQHKHGKEFTPSDFETVTLTQGELDSLFD